jgi:hypothetical protein
MSFVSSIRPIPFYLSLSCPLSLGVAKPDDLSVESQKDFDIDLQCANRVSEVKIVQYGRV